jgi:hypothetical protein
MVRRIIVAPSGSQRPGHLPAGRLRGIGRELSASSESIAYCLPLSHIKRQIRTSRYVAQLTA